MLIAKINPPAVKYIESTPFSSTTQNLEYMTAMARPYIPGSSSTSFEILFGNTILNGINEIVEFQNQLNTQLSMTSEELSTWGTNDDVLLNLIATKLGVSVLEIINVPGNNF